MAYFNRVFAIWTEGSRKIALTNRVLFSRTILCQSFEDCSGLQAYFRVLEIFGSIVYRPEIQTHFGPNFFTLLKVFDADLEEVQLIFIHGKSNPPMHLNMAPVTGALSWIHEIKERISKTMDRLCTFNHSAFQSDEFSLLKSKYDTVIAGLNVFEQQLFGSWSKTIIDESEANLSKPLLLRTDNGLLQVNFDVKVAILFICLFRGRGSVAGG